MIDTIVMRSGEGPISPTEQLVAVSRKDADNLQEDTQARLWDGTKWTPVEDFAIIWKWMGGYMNEVDNIPVAKVRGLPAISETMGEIIRAAR